MAIYKILSRGEWELAQKTGRFGGSEVDRRDGFIHFSSAEQVVATAAKHFAGQDQLVLLRVDDSAAGDQLRWERSRDGQLFPHLYADMPADWVLAVFELPLDSSSGDHIWPDRWND